MVKFEGFPEDDALWMVKCIDRFRLPHAATESASIDVRLQRVEASSARELARASRQQIHDLFGGNERGPSAFRNVRVHAGSLPALRPGQLFQNGEYRAELPAQIISVELPHAETSGHAGRLDELLDPPEDWPRRRPYPRLLAQEFDLLEAEWRHQKVLVLDGGDRDIILPRTVIFQRCYGPHSEMADAFASGNWETVRPRLLSDADFDNGLKTRAAPELNEWHLVLETLIPNGFRWHVALFAFHEYAQQQARALYSEAQAQRARRKNDPFWFCTATLPFDPNYPLTLRLKGYGLRPVPGRPKGTFLVTSIIGAKLGQPLPRLAYGRANDGTDAPEVVEVDAPKPYLGKEGRDRKSRDHRKVGSTCAPPTGGAVSAFPTDTFEWVGNLDERLLEKRTSKRYVGGFHPSVPSGDGADSTAKPIAGGSAGRHLQMALEVRPRIAHFHNLIECLLALRKSQQISGFNVVQPENSDLRAESDGHIVWDLTEREVKSFGARPKRWWRMITPLGCKDRILLGRTLLVVEATWESSTALLFEIECRPKERGYRMPAMIFDASRPRNIDVLCGRMLREIVDREGRNLAKASHEIASAAGGRGGAYRHRYVAQGGQKRLDSGNLMAFLTKGPKRKLAQPASTLQDTYL